MNAKTTVGFRYASSRMRLGPWSGTPALFLVLFLLGAYYAATDGVLMAMGSAHVPEALRGSGLSLLGTAVSVARLFASVLFGALWTWPGGIETALPDVTRRSGDRDRRRRCRAPELTGMSRRGLAFALLCFVCAVVAVAAVGSAARLASEEDRKAEQAAAVVRPTVARLLDDGQPFVVFRSLDRNDGSTYGRMALAPLDVPTPGDRLLAGPECERVDLAPGAGCASARRIPSASARKVLDRTLTKTGTVRLAGVPSRTRVSPDGRYGAVTSFVSGHSYADVGRFLTQRRSSTCRRAQGRRPREASRSPSTARPKAVDRNFWGVTFSAATATVLRHDGDRRADLFDPGGPGAPGTGSARTSSAPRCRRTERIAYKKAVGTARRSGASTCSTWPPGTRSPGGGAPVDDQVEWLDDETSVPSGESTSAVPPTAAASRVAGSPPGTLRRSFAPGVS